MIPNEVRNLKRRFVRTVEIFAAVGMTDRCIRDGAWSGRSFVGTQGFEPIDEFGIESCFESCVALKLVASCLRRSQWPVQVFGECVPIGLVFGFHPSEPIDAEPYVSDLVAMNRPHHGRSASIAGPFEGIGKRQRMIQVGSFEDQR